MNRQQILDTLATHGPLTSIRIAGHLDVEVGLVHSIASKLLQEGRVVVSGSEPQPRGRPARVFAVGKPAPPRPIVAAPTAYPAWMAPPAPAAPPTASVTRRTWADI